MLDSVSCFLYRASHDALVAQLDRATGYEPVGQEFESLRAHHNKKQSVSCNRLTAFFVSFLQQGVGAKMPHAIALSLSRASPFA